MKTHQGEAGSVSIAALVLLFLLAAVAGGGALIFGASLSRERKSEEASDLRSSLLREGQRIVEELAADPTPQSDSPFDPVWSAACRPELEGASVTLADISSALNPNWVQKNVFEKTGLRGLLRPGRSADELQQRREDRGFSSNAAAAYGDLFTAVAVEKYLTTYGPVNINVTDEFALRRLYALRTGDTAASEVFHAKVQTLLRQKKILTREELRAFLAADYDRLSPVMNVEPVLNAHFVDPVILAELLGYPELKVPQPRQAAQDIMAARERSELTIGQLRGMIGAPDDSRIYQYVGAVTWFWKVSVIHPSALLTMVVARISGDPDSPARFMIIEERFSRR
jgi:hypothetical protein